MSGHDSRGCTCEHTTPPYPCASLIWWARLTLRLRLRGVPLGVAESAAGLEVDAAIRERRRASLALAAALVES